MLWLPFAQRYLKDSGTHTTDKNAKIVETSLCETSSPDLFHTIFAGSIQWLVIPGFFAGSIH